MPKNEPTPTPSNLDKPLTIRELPAALVDGLALMFAERNAWQVFGNDVQAFHMERNLAKDFESWLDKRRAAQDKKRKK